MPLFPLPRQVFLPDGKSVTVSTANPVGVEGYAQVGYEQQLPLWYSQAVGWGRSGGIGRCLGGRMHVPFWNLVQPSK